jgi:hypothetical protein
MACVAATSALADDNPLRWLPMPEQPVDGLHETIGIQAMHALPDDDLKVSRALCALGKNDGTFASESTARGNTSDAGADCLLTLRYTIQRGFETHFYWMRQRDNLAAEMRAVLQAASQDATRYVDASGEDKELLCETAIDIGFWYGGQKPDLTVAADRSDQEMLMIANDCYTKQVTGQTRKALHAGIRLGQLSAKTP